jgi:alanyl-tRNA synthetase
VARLQADLTAARRALEKHHEEALDREAAALRSEGVPLGGSLTVVTRRWQGRPAEDLKGLALRLTAEPNVVALLATAGERTQLVLGRAEQDQLDLKPALDAAFAVLGGGKGGGGRLVQGGGPAADLDRVDEALAAARAALQGP